MTSATSGQQWTPAVNTGVGHFPSKFPRHFPTDFPKPPWVVLAAGGGGMEILLDEVPLAGLVASATMLAALLTIPRFVT